jgi:hypothetical protein
MSARHESSHVKQLREGVTALQKESAGVIKVEILGSLWELQNFEDVASVAQFARYVERGERPMCLLCNHEWKSFDQAPPAGFVKMKAAMAADPQAGLVSGLCERCMRRPDLLKRVFEALKRLWPNLRIADVHESPSAVS